MKKIISIIIITFFCFCNYNLKNENNVITIGIEDKFSTFFYYDSLFEDWIFPSAHVCDTQNGIIVTMFPGGSDDYTCTNLPDTVWAIFKYNLFHPDSFICFSDTCWAINDTFFYSMINYFNGLFDAVCNEKAQAYTKKEFNYLCSS